MLCFGSYIIYVVIQKIRIKFYDHILYRPLSSITSAKEAEFLFVILWSMVERMSQNGNFIKFIGFLQVNLDVLKEDCPVIIELLSDGSFVEDFKNENHEINNQLEDKTAGLQNVFLH